MRLGLGVDAFVLLLKTEHGTSVEEGIVVGLANPLEGWRLRQGNKAGLEARLHRVSPETPAAL